MFPYSFLSLRRGLRSGSGPTGYQGAPFGESAMRPRRFGAVVLIASVWVTDVRSECVAEGDWVPVSTPELEECFASFSADRLVGVTDDGRHEFFHTSLRISLRRASGRSGHRQAWPG